ncbi:hypothetical protein VQH23_13825 [Pararoseomonas sp. SCSIO 73927]|uniref:hypothetical protein n=1 Tax=Pararoseomonas sp. SCSIO 73927 TaxID=3114537 RepID=UPI0030CB7C39
MIVAADATHRGGICAWAVVFANGHAATGSADSKSINEGEVRAAILALDETAPGTPLVIISDSEALLQAIQRGRGDLTRRQVWADYQEATRKFGPSFLIRRDESAGEAELHRQAHHLARAAWMAASDEDDLLGDARKGWRSTRLSRPGMDVILSRGGFDLMFHRDLTASQLRGTQIEMAGIMATCDCRWISGKHLRLCPKEKDTSRILTAIKRIVTDIEGPSGG